MKARQDVTPETLTRQITGMSVMVSIFGNARFMVCIAPGGGAAVHAYIPFAFQFHMVQLELIRTVRACIFFSSFNSIMVQLELAVDARNTERSMFQFHKGSIRTMRPLFPQPCCHVSVP